MKPLFAALLLFLTEQASATDDRITERISAASLRGRVAFLASDSLEGRDTPSRGLDVSADYLASEFRRLDLESPPGGDYAQTAEFLQITHRTEGLLLVVSGGGDAPKSVAPERISVESMHAARLMSEPIFKWAPGVRIDSSLAGKILMLRAPAEPTTLRKLALSRPDAIVQLVRSMSGLNWRAERIISKERDRSEGPAVVSVPHGDLEAIFDRLPTGNTSAHATLHISAPDVKPAILRNIVGVVRGADPKLRDQYLVISAHYDHLGVARSGGDADHIFNGANDDASGVATLMELAQAFAGEKSRPARTLVFVCFFGEEKGLLGSEWYTQHPPYPLSQTVADLNFEQLGIPDREEGLPAGSIGATGYQFSTLPESVEKDFQAAGVELRDVPHNDDYFERSDNLAFAEAGVPAHTFLAALDFPDYHRVSDEWRKLNYENMAKLTQGLALAILDLANRPEIPEWNASNKKAKEYLTRWRSLHK